MRKLADSTRIERFMRELGRAVNTEGHVYLTGGATAVLYGWRETTIDVDIKLIPDSDDILARYPASRRSSTSTSSSRHPQISFPSQEAGRIEVR
jgi:hypothetical protein